MGLDLIELEMAAEDRFGVSLEGLAWDEIWTVGDFVAAVRRRLGDGPSAGAGGACPTAAAFFRVRDLVREATGEAGFRVRPREALADRLSPDARRRLWRRLPAELGCRPPGLRPRWDEPPSTLGWGAFVGSLAAVLGFEVAAMNGVNRAAGIVAVGGAVAGAAALWLWAWPGYRTRPPWGWETAGAVALKLAARGPAAGAPVAGEGRRDPGWAAVFDGVRELIVSEIGVRPEDVTPRARFVEDLRFD